MLKTFYGYVSILSMSPVAPASRRLLQSFFILFLLVLSGAVAGAGESLSKNLQSFATNSIVGLPEIAFQGEGQEDSEQRILFSAEGGLALFDTGEEGQFPDAAFRVDEAKVFIDASIWTDIYAFAEVNILTREADEDDLEIGELYVDFENVSKLWGKEGILNVRVGRMDIPFGEEYLTRDAIDNPLISHSLSDFWGVDEGVEAYGRIKQVHYVVAVQNGGAPLLNDFNADKSIAGRVGVDAGKHIYFSVSAMRTGKLDVEGDEISELWFGNAFFRAMGSPSTTTNFRANLFQADIRLKWDQGSAAAASGYLNFDDNDSTQDNQRDIYHFYAQGVKRLMEQGNDQLYAAARLSYINAPDGFPIVGLGDFGLYFFNPAFLTTTIWRLSAGIGYRIGQHALIKAEYSFEHRTELNRKKEGENFLAAEVAFRF